MGDVVHNLHSAIDILYCDILRHEGHGVNEHSKWPFRRTRAELAGAFNGRKGQSRLRSEIVNLIVDSIQTYRGGRGDALYALHDLNIEDKHMLLLPTINITEVDGVEFVDATGIIGKFQFKAWGASFFGTGAHSRVEAATDIVEIKNAGKAAFDVLFGQGACCGKPLTPTLCELSQHVVETVDTVEKCLQMCVATV